MSDTKFIAEKIRDAMAYRFPSLAKFEAPVIINAIKEVLDEHLGPPPAAAKSFDEAWDRWIEFRKERMLRSYKTIGGKMAKARILKWGEARAIAAIEYSMAQGYQGIFEDKAAAGKEGKDITEWERSQKATRLVQLKAQLREVTNPGGSAWPVELTEEKLQQVIELQTKILALKKELNK